MMRAGAPGMQDTGALSRRRANVIPPVPAPPIVVEAADRRRDTQKEIDQ